jgi:hypothetical protein
MWIEYFIHLDKTFFLVDEKYFHMESEKRAKS